MSVNAVAKMARKKRTDQPHQGESSEPQEASAGGGRGRGAPQRPAERASQPQQGGGGGYQGGGGGYQGGGRGWAPQGGRGGYGGGGSGRGRGPPQQQQQQQYGGPPEYQQGRGRGGPPQQGGRGGGYGGGGRGTGGVGGGRGGGPSGVPSRPQVPELHQATPAPYQAGISQPLPSEASSSAGPPEISQLAQHLEQIGLQPETAPSQAIQPAPPSSKSMRFPLRPGKGSSGIKCIVKANHFFAELPDKDLHQYDVSSLALYSVFWRYCSIFVAYWFMILVYF